ncbi:Signal peptide peptidase-like 2B [Chionoecetes opilio]|uniref:Signal peptide peptidase-like 2B n=1 Tax=Chionoecetes opilio TaxID=41210 RepID=A0A8J4XS88_CHIOP|nr:Signal peptide peptidase-like 2B [Chionoecetes opilio]
MALTAWPTTTLIYTIISQCVVQALAEYPMPGILSSHPNASSHEVQKYCVFYYRSITKLATDEHSAQYYPVADASEWDVCDEPERPPAGLDMQGRFVFLSDDNCSTVEKANIIQSHGGVGTLILRARTKILNLNETIQYNFTLAFLHNYSYTRIMGSGNEVTVGLYSPAFTPFTPSLAIIWVMALFTVSLGAFWSGKIRHKLYLSERESTVRVGSEVAHEGGMPREETSMSLSPINIIGFMLLMCLMLLSLYYFYKYLVYVIIGMFCFASSMAVYSCLHPLVSRIPCGTCRTPYFNIYLVRGTLELRQILLLLFAVGLAVVWVVMRKEPWAWILQDTLGIAFCVNVLRMVRLPNLKIITILLCGLLIYDIFFVFITPLLTPDRKSIMVEVAKGGSSTEQLPIVLKVPSFGREITDVCRSLDDYNLLGFGDILVPGLLIAFVCSFDLQMGTPRHLYYLVNVIDQRQGSLAAWLGYGEVIKGDQGMSLSTNQAAPLSVVARWCDIDPGESVARAEESSYGVGLLVTFVALWLLSGAQPALLYLVPFTLLPTMITAAIRGEFKAMWAADSDKWIQTEVYIDMSDREFSCVCLTKWMLFPATV